MTKKEIIEMLKKISAAYPGLIKPDMAVVDAWEMAVGGLPRQKVNMAVAEYIFGEKYPPKPCDISRLCSEIDRSINHIVWDFSHTVLLPWRIWNNPTVADYIYKQQLDKANHSGKPDS